MLPGAKPHVDLHHWSKAIVPQTNTPLVDPQWRLRLHHTFKLALASPQRLRPPALQTSTIDLNCKPLIALAYFSLFLFHPSIHIELDPALCHSFAYPKRAPVDPAAAYC